MNRYLVKIAMDPFSAAALHAVGVHVAQNLGMKQALKSKTLAKHVANGFRQGTEGVVDNSFKSKAKQVALGATLPEVNILHSSAHSLGSKLAPALEKMTLKEKALLHRASMGALSSKRVSQIVNNPRVGEAYSHLQKHMKLPDLEKVKDLKNLASDKRSPLVSNILKNIHKGDAPVGNNFIKGSPKSRYGIGGSAASFVADPLLGSINAAKSMLASQRIKNTSVGGKIVKGLDEVLVKHPFNKGVAGKVHSTKAKDLANDLAISPINTQLKRLGDAISPLNNHL